MNTASAEDALVGIVAIEGIGHIHFIWLGLVRNLLVFHLKELCRVVHGAVAVVVVANCAVEQMIAEALDETMATIEARMETKVRKGYQQDNRVSPNMVYAKFVHGETRPVDGIPDPHYHIHVFAMNATFDEVEKEWKALEVGNTVGDRTFYEAHFHHLLATKLEACRYGIRRTEQHFEFARVGRELVEKFSRRTELIE